MINNKPTNATWHSCDLISVGWCQWLQSSATHIRCIILSGSWIWMNYCPLWDCVTPTISASVEQLFESIYMQQVCIQQKLRYTRSYHYHKLCNGWDTDGNKGKVKVQQKRPRVVCDQDVLCLPSAMAKCASWSLTPLSANRIRYLAARLVLGSLRAIRRASTLTFWSVSTIMPLVLIQTRRRTRISSRREGIACQAMLDDGSCDLDDHWDLLRHVTLLRQPLQLHECSRQSNGRRGHSIHRFATSNTLQPWVRF